MGDISFLVDLCYRATHKQEATLRMMLQVPGVTPEALQGCTPQTNSEAEQKSSRVLMKKLLQHLTGVRSPSTLRNGRAGAQHWSPLVADGAKARTMEERGRQAINHTDVVQLAVRRLPRPRSR